MASKRGASRCLVRRREEAGDALAARWDCTNPLGISTAPRTHDAWFRAVPKVSWWTTVASPGRALSVACLCFALHACTTSPFGQPQPRLRENASVLDDRDTNRYVQCSVSHVGAQAEPGRAWEVTVFADDDANAFALPGLGAQYGGILPYGRAQEREADRLDRERVARAGS